MITLTLYSIGDAAEAVGIAYISFLAKLRDGSMPEPTFQYGQRRYYLELDTIKEYADKSKRLSRNQIAKAIGVGYDKINYWISTAEITPPTIIEGKRDFYPASELDAIRKQVAELKPKPKSNPYAVAAKEGIYTKTRAAKALGMPKITFDDWINRKLLPPPTRSIGLIVGYNTADIASMKAVVAKSYKPQPKKGNH